eukprot:CFRG7930T1
MVKRFSTPVKRLFERRRSQRDQLMVCSNVDGSITNFSSGLVVSTGCAQRKGKYSSMHDDYSVIHNLSIPLPGKGKSVKEEDASTDNDTPSYGHEAAWSAVFDGTLATDFATKVLCKRFLEQLEKNDGDIEKSLKDAFALVDEELTKLDGFEASKTRTSVLVVVVAHNALYVSNVGDSVAFCIYQPDVKKRLSYPMRSRRLLDVEPIQGTYGSGNCSPASSSVVSAPRTNTRAYTHHLSPASSSTSMPTSDTSAIQSKSWSKSRPASVHVEDRLSFDIGVPAIVRTQNSPNSQGKTNTSGFEGKGKSAMVYETVSNRKSSSEFGKANEFFVNKHVIQENSDERRGSSSDMAQQNNSNSPTFRSSRSMSGGVLANISCLSTSTLEENKSARKRSVPNLPQRRSDSYGSQYNAGGSGQLNRIEIMKPQASKNSLGLGVNYERRETWMTEVSRRRGSSGSLNTTKVIPVGTLVDGVVKLNNTHIASSFVEKQGVIQRGGRVQGNKVNGDSRTTRALGAKNCGAGVTCESEIYVHQLEDDGSHAVVMATNGLWDFCTITQVTDFLQQNLTFRIDQNLDVLAGEVVKLAKGVNRTVEDITVIIILVVSPNAVQARVDTQTVDNVSGTVDTLESTMRSTHVGSDMHVHATNVGVNVNVHTGISRTLKNEETPAVSPVPSSALVDSVNEVDTAATTANIQTRTTVSVKNVYKKGDCESKPCRCKTSTGNALGEVKEVEDTPDGDKKSVTM